MHRDHLAIAELSEVGFMRAMWDAASPST